VRKPSTNRPRIIERRRYSCIHETFVDGLSCQIEPMVGSYIPLENRSRSRRFCRTSLQTCPAFGYGPGRMASGHRLSGLAPRVRPEGTGWKPRSDYTTDGIAHPLSLRGGGSRRRVTPRARPRRNPLAKLGECASRTVALRRLWRLASARGAMTRVAGSYTLTGWNCLTIACLGPPPPSANGWDASGTVQTGKGGRGDGDEEARIQGEGR